MSALFAREWVEDLETRRAAGGDREEIDRMVERVGLDFQISTRLSSWVAVGELIEAKGELLRERMPHELPFGSSIEGFGLRGPMVASPEPLFEASRSLTAAGGVPAGMVAPKKARGVFVQSMQRKSEAPSELELDAFEDAEEEMKAELRPAPMSPRAIEKEPAAALPTKRARPALWVLVILLLLAVALGLWLAIRSLGGSQAQPEQPTRESGSLIVPHEGGPWTI